jgi:hypothetical protein
MFIWSGIKLLISSSFYIYYVLQVYSKSGELLWMVELSTICFYVKWDKTLFNFEVSQFFKLQICKHHENKSDII